MPSFKSYQKICHTPSTLGQARKQQSDRIINETWFGDIDARVSYLYDWYHDDEPLKLLDLNPEQCKEKIPIEIKYIPHTSQTYSKDTVTFHLQLRPGQVCNVDYYAEMFQLRYGATFPVGLYIDIPDNNGVFNKWLIVHKANYYSPQFSTFEILPCDKIFQWVIKGKKYQMAGVLRSQNSYNSGIWTDYRTTSVEDQQKFLVPLNRDSEKLFYNQRLLIDSPVLTEPRAWQISKVNRISPPGICIVTCAQTLFDEHRDYIEKDETGAVIGQWADYYAEPIQEPTEVTINCSGVTHELRVGGKAKTLTVQLPDGITSNGIWEYTINNTDASDFVKTSVTDVLTNKLTFTGGSEHIGETLKVKYVDTENNLSGSIELQITAL